MSIDNLQLLVKKRFLRSASLSHSQTPNSDSYGALRYRTPHIPNSDSYGALRYRIPTSPKAIPTERFAIAPPPHIPKAIPTERFAIALPHPQTAIPTERFAIASQHRKQRYLLMIYYTLTIS
jgi:hypothetical protein